MAQKLGLVGDHDDCLLHHLHARERLGERGLALGVEIGVGLVQDEETGIAIERARESQALALAAGQHDAALAHLRLVPLGQAQDRLVHHGGLGGGDHGPIIGHAEAQRYSPQPCQVGTRSPGAGIRYRDRGGPTAIG